MHPYFTTARKLLKLCVYPSQPWIECVGSALVPSASLSEGAFCTHENLSNFGCLSNRRVD